MKRNQWPAVLLAAALFLGGGVIGALADRYYSTTVVSAKGGAEDFRQRYVSDMKSRVRLTPAQLNQLDAILDDTKSKVKAVRDQFHPAMVKIHEEQISRVRAILTPEQVPAFERLVAERERRAKEQEERDQRAEQKRAAARRSGAVQ